jgi:O-antigen ligase
MPLSIAVAESALWLAALLWCVNWLRRELTYGGDVPDAPARGPAGDVFSLVGTPLMAFWGVSVISALASRDPIQSLWDLRDVFLFAAPFVTYLAFRDPALRKLGLRVFGVGVLLAVLLGLGETWAAIQTGAFPGTYRPDGTLGHYMTYAGALMLSIPLLLTLREGWVGVWHRAVAAGALLLVGLTMTRSAWIGCLAGFTVYFLARFVSGTGAQATRRRGGRVFAGVTLTIAIVLASVLLLSLAGPEVLYERGASIFSLENPTNVDRLAMAATGLRIVAAHPLLGIGPGLMERVYPAWRVDWAVKETNPHLHNDLLQIAGERGLLGLAAWIWLMIAIAVGAWRVLRHAGAFEEGGAEARAALACLAAFLTMGLFEYNFSDSEVLMILLFAVTLPFAASDGIRRRGDTIP